MGRPSSATTAWADAAPARRRGPGRRPDPRAAPGRRHPALRTDSRRTDALISLDPKDGAIRSLVGGFSSSRATTTARSGQAPAGSVSSRSSTARPWTTASPPPAWSTMRRSCSSTSTWTRSGDRRTAPIPSSARSRCAKPCSSPQHGLDPRPAGLGIEQAISFITEFGFQRDELPRNFSLALGTAAVTPMEIAGAWSVFANGGYKVNPYVIERIESRDGRVLYQANPPSVPVEEQVAAPDAEDAGKPGDPRASGERRRRKFDRSPASRRQGPDHPSRPRPSGSSMPVPPISRPACCRT